MVSIICQDFIFPNIEAIFFDKDGTLEDSRLYLQKLAEERFKQIVTNIPNIQQDLLLAWGITKNGLNPEGLMAVGSREENELAAAAYIASSGSSWFKAKDIANQAFNNAAKEIVPQQELSPLFAGSLEVIKSLFAANLKLGIISADSTEGIKNFLAREKIADYFQLVLGSDEEYSKPNPLLYLSACKLLQVKPKNTIMIGDSLGDLTMAQQANARATIGICWHNKKAKYLELATTKISHLSEIKVINY